MAVSPVFILAPKNNKYNGFTLGLHEIFTDFLFIGNRFTWANPETTTLQKFWQALYPFWLYAWCEQLWLHRHAQTRSLQPIPTALAHQRCTTWWPNRHSHYHQARYPYHPFSLYSNAGFSRARTHLQEPRHHLVFKWHWRTTRQFDQPRLPNDVAVQNQALQQLYGILAFGNAIQHRPPISARRLSKLLRPFR